MPIWFLTYCFCLETENGLRKLKVHLTLVRMIIIKKFTNNKCWRRCGEKGTLMYCWWECKLIQLLWKTVWSFLKKLKVELPYDPTIQLLGIYMEKTIIRKNVHCSIVYNIQDYTSFFILGVY